MQIYSNVESENMKMDQRDDKPLVTYILVAFNQDKYISKAIKSALAETYRPIQFIFSDDCSTDRTYEIMCKVTAQHGESKNVFLNQNDQNIGVVDHLNKLIIDLAEGKYIVVLAGDDITTKDRTAKIVACFEATGASAVSVNPMMIDEDGKSSGKRFFPDFPCGVLHFEEYFVKGAAFFGGAGYSRELFDTYGPMKNSARNEDRILPCRASTLGGIAYLNDPVYFYREHGKNMSFWVKIKADPLNSSIYETESRRNELQNLANFMQEVRKSYQGENKNKMLTQIDARYNRKRFEFDASKLGIIQKLALFPTAFRIGKNFREALNLFLTFAFPKLYRILHTVRQAFR
jgi:glycosyltransferase involved in cell wall biosynthesis